MNRIVDCIPWILSVITLVQIHLAGNRHHYAWAIGLGNQVLWITWIVLSGTWGLMPLTVALIVLYTRNHLKWMRER